MFTEIESTEIICVDSSCCTIHRKIIKILIITNVLLYYFYNIYIFIFYIMCLTSGSNVMYDVLHIHNNLCVVL